MPENVRQNAQKNTFLVLLILIGWGTLTYAEDEVEPQAVTNTNSKGETFTVMNVDAVIAYRNERQSELEESLTLSNLSSEHQELVTNAMAKVFVGIPVSSYTEISRQEYLKEEVNESTDNWIVSEDGHIQYEDIPISRSLTFESPFLFLPPVPFLPETGTLIDSTGTTVTFEFKTDKSKIDKIGESVLADFPLKSNLLVELTADKIEQRPKRIAIKLRKPIRLPLVFAIKTVSLEYEYSFIENCECFAVSRSKTQLDASMIFAGRIFISRESTFDNILCEQPLQFLLPKIE